MYTPAVRMLLGLGGVVLTYYFYQRGATTSVYLTILAVFLVVWGYFKNGTVSLAWKKAKKQEFDHAENIILQTKFPQFLKREQRGFYHFIFGLIEANRKNFDEAYKHFTDALAFGVSTENNAAIINLNLAEIELDRGNLNQAKAHMQITRTLKYNPDLEKEINKIETKINNAAQHCE